jgi:hypothetical protein
LGTRGLRAEYAEIVALTYENCEINKRIIDLYAERYEIPVFETMEKLIAEYPRSDVSDLIPEEKPVEQSNFTDLRQLYLNDFGDAMKRLWVALPPSTGTPVYRPNEHVTWWTNTTTNTAAYGVGGGMTMSVDDSPIITIASGGDGGGYYISPQDSTWHLNYESE